MERMGPQSSAVARTPNLVAGRSRRALVALGSNLGDRELELAAARSFLAAQGALVAVSEVIETDAWGRDGSPSYLNQVVDLSSCVLPWTLHAQGKQHELARGRDDRSGVNAPRVIDVDLLVVHGTTVRSALFCLPHPRLWRRTFLHAVLDTLPSLDEWRVELESSGLWDLAAPGR